MIDREKVLVVLHKRFPGATADQVAAAANAIVGLPDEWEDVTGPKARMESCVEGRYTGCLLSDWMRDGGDVRVFVRRATEP